MTVTVTWGGDGRWGRFWRRVGGGDGEGDRWGGACGDGVLELTPKNFEREVTKRGRRVRGVLRAVVSVLQTIGTYLE